MDVIWAQVTEVSFFPCVFLLPIYSLSMTNLTRTCHADHWPSLTSLSCGSFFYVRPSLHWRRFSTLAKLMSHGLLFFWFLLIVFKILWQYSQSCSYGQNKIRRVFCLAFKSISSSFKKFRKTRIRTFIWIFTLGPNIWVFGQVFVIDSEKKKLKAWKKKFI